MSPADATPDATADASGRDELAALDFGTPPGPSEPDRPAEPGSADGPFRVTNPPGTVTVTTFEAGRVAHIELTAGVTRMTEAQLADEVVVIATLATARARASQHAAMLAHLRADGHDEAAVEEFLVRDLDLPSPRTADAALAGVFARRYAADPDGDR